MWSLKSKKKKNRIHGAPGDQTKRPNNCPVTQLHSQVTVISLHYSNTPIN